MRSFYEISAEGQATSHGADARIRRFVQLSTLAYWGPCASVDFFLLWRDGVGAGAFVFGVLFRQALVFLALWFAVAASHGVMRGRRRPDDEPTERQLRAVRRRATLEDHGYTAPSRGNRGQ